MPDFDLIEYLNARITEYDTILTYSNLSEHTRKEFEYFKAFAEWFKAVNNNASKDEILRLATVRDTKSTEANEATNRYMQEHPSP